MQGRFANYFSIICIYFSWEEPTHITLLQKGKLSCSVIFSSKDEFRTPHLAGFFDSVALFTYWIVWKGEPGQGDIPGEPDFWARSLPGWTLHLQWRGSRFDSDRVHNRSRFSKTKTAYECGCPAKLDATGPHAVAILILRKIAYCWGCRNKVSAPHAGGATDNYVCSDYTASIFVSHFVKTRIGNESGYSRPEFKC